MPAALDPDFAALLAPSQGTPTPGANAAAPRGNSPNFLTALRTYDKSGSSNNAGQGSSKADQSGFLAALAKAPPPTAADKVDALFAGAANKQPSGTGSGALDPDFAALLPGQKVDALFAGAQAQNSPPAGTGAAQPTDLTDRLANYVRPYLGSIGQQAIRQTGLVGRAVAEAAQRTANVIPDAGNALLQLATNPQARAATLSQLAHPSTWLTFPANAPSSIVSRGLSRVLPTPQSRPEKVAGLVEGLMAGSRMPLFPGAAQATRIFQSPGAPSVLTGAQQAAGTRSALTDAQQAAATGGRALGMKLTPGQASGSKALQQLEARLESSPWTSGPFNAIKSGNQGALNRAAAQSIGEDTNTVDSTVLARANERLGETFENVRSPNHTIMFDPAGTKATLDSIDQEFEGLLPGDMSIRANKLVGQLNGLASNGHTTAQQLGQLSSKLGKAAFKQMSGPTGDRDLGQALYRVKDHVDDMLESSLTGQERAEYAAARGQYRNLMTLTSRGSIVNPSTGNVSGTALASKLQQADKPGFLYGRNQSPMYQAARFAQAFKPLVGDSGTATRSGGHAGLWSAGLLAEALARGAPLEHAIGEAAIPFALRAGSNLGTRAYLTQPGGALLRGAMAFPGATASAGRSLITNPALLPSIVSRTLPSHSGLMARDVRPTPRRVRGLMAMEP